LKRRTGRRNTKEEKERKRIAEGKVTVGSFRQFWKSKGIKLESRVKKPGKVGGMSNHDC